jgi:membrane protein
MVQEKARKAKGHAKKFARNFVEILKSPEMQLLPGQLAFYFIMSVIPIAAISAMIASYITKSFNFYATVHNMLPPVFASILTSLSEGTHMSGLAFVFVIYIIASLNAPSSIIIASNMFYEVKQPSYLKLKLKSLVMTVMIILLLLFVILIPLFGDSIFQFIATATKTDIYKDYKVLYTIIKALGSFFIMYFIIRLVYTYAPSRRIDKSTTVRGSLFTSVGWIFATYAFAFYITRIASYNVVYGNFANILILLLWVYILAYLFVVGLALNVNDFHKQRKCLNEKSKKEKNKEERKVKTK